MKWPRICLILNETAVKKMPSCTSKFTAHKVRKIRWQPIPKNYLEIPNQFVTGSWDENENVITLWSCPSNPSEGNHCLDPKVLHQTKHPGNVTELKFINADTLIAGSSNGSVLLYKYQRQSLKAAREWEGIHKFNVSDKKCPCSCTSLDTFENEIISVGEDGKIIQLNCNSPNAIRTLDGGDICTINCVRYLNQFQVVTANMRGQLRIWDLREPGNVSAKKFIVVGDCVGVHCLSQHPHQHQILASGSEDGSLCIWDTRQENYPVNLLSAHDAAMLEVKFHPHNPNHLFTCSQNGAVWHWDCSSINQTQTTALSAKGVATEVVPESNPWLVCSAAKHRIDICSLLPTSFLAVNSIDIEMNTLICGSDNEAFYIIPNVIES